MRRLKRHDLRHLTAEIRTLACWIHDHAEDIADRANADLDEAIRSSAGGTRASGHSDPTGLAATHHRYDPAGLAISDLLDSLHNAKDEMRRAERNSRSLLAIPNDKAASLAKDSPATRGAHCANPNCGRWVENTRDDRIREGRCMSCYQHRRRTGNERRPEADEVAEGG